MEIYNKKLMQFFINILNLLLIQLSQLMNNQFVQFLAPKLRREMGFTKPISFQVFLIIRLFGFIPHEFTIGTKKQYKAA